MFYYSLTKGFNVANLRVVDTDFKEWRGMGIGMNHKRFKS